MPSNPKVQNAEHVNLRDWFAGSAPITIDDAMYVCGDISLALDSERAVLLATLALMRYEYADAMLAKRLGR